MSAASGVIAGVALAGALLLGGARPVPAQDLADWRIEQKRILQAVSASSEIRIVNRWGDVSLRVGEGNEIVLSTIAQRHREDPRESKVYIEEIPSGFLLQVRFPEHPEVEERAEWQPRRVDIGVVVPSTLAVSIRTGDDKIEVRGLVGRADLETVSGHIEFRGPGGLRARSDSGSIFAQFKRSDWPAPVEIETRIGDVRAELLEGAAATVEVETRGPITSDYSIAIERAAGSRLKRGIAIVGEDGQTLKLTSHSGAVRLLAVIVPEEKDN